MTKFLVTGCTGFIGSFFCKYVLHNHPDVSIVGTNRSSNQRNLKRLEDALWNPRFNLVYKDLAKDDISDLFQDVNYVFHFSSLTFVDRSIQSPLPFIESNIVGGYKVLEEARKSRTLKLLLNVSTDEVYGQILSGSYREDAQPNPSNPYAATKMAMDALVMAYHNSYGIPTITTRTENNYGEFQGPEKVFPTFVRKALNNERLPVYGDGQHIRCWLYVEDHVRALLHLIEHGKSGEIYHIAGGRELTNLDLAKWILRLLGKPKDMIEFVPDANIRPGHDRRYSLSTEKIKTTGWEPKWTLEDGIKKTVDWYRNNMWWQQ